MQIHELTEASFLQRLKTGVQAGAQKAAQAVADRPAAQMIAKGQSLSDPAALAQAQQNLYAKQAAKAAQQLKAKGYGAQPKTQTIAPGQKIKVSANIGGVAANYFKTATGWENELGQPVTNAASVNYLEQLLAEKPAAAGATATAQAVMTTPEFNQALTQMQISPRQLDTLKATMTQNPSFTRALLKRLGLSK